MRDVWENLFWWSRTNCCEACTTEGSGKPNTGYTFTGPQKSICINQPNQSNFFNIYMTNVSTDNLFCSGFGRKKNQKHCERLIEKQLL